MAIQSIKRTLCFPNLNGMSAINLLSLRPGQAVSLLSGGPLSSSDCSLPLVADLCVMSCKQPS